MGLSLCSRQEIHCAKGCWKFKRTGVVGVLLAYLAMFPITPEVSSMHIDAIAKILHIAHLITPQRNSQTSGISTMTKYPRCSGSVCLASALLCSAFPRS